MCICKQGIFTWCDGDRGFCTEEALERECPVSKDCMVQYSDRYVDDHCRSHPSHNGHDSRIEGGNCDGDVDIPDNDAAPVFDCNDQILQGGLSVFDLALPEAGSFDDAMASCSLGPDTNANVPSIFDTFDFDSPGDTFTAEQPFHDTNGVEYVEKLQIFEQPRYTSIDKDFGFDLPSVSETALDNFVWTTALPTETELELELELDAMFSNLPGPPFASPLPVDPTAREQDVLGEVMVSVQKQEMASPTDGLDRTVNGRDGYVDARGISFTSNVSIKNVNGDINGNCNVDMDGSTLNNHPSNSDVDGTSIDVYAMSPAFLQVMARLIPRSPVAMATPESVATETSFTENNIKSQSPRPRPRPRTRTGPLVPVTRGMYGAPTLEFYLEHNIENALARSPTRSRTHTRIHTPEPSVSASASTVLTESPHLALAPRPAATPSSESEDIDADTATSSSYIYTEIGSPDAEDGGPDGEPEEEEYMEAESASVQGEEKEKATNRKRRRAKKPLTMIKYGWKKKKKEGM